MDRSLFFSFFAILLIASGAFGSVEPVACEDYYTFDGLKFKVFQPQKVDYVAGDNVTIDYEIVNEFGAPLVEGDVKVMVIYQGPELVNRIEDGDVVDDFFAFEDVNIQAGDGYEGSFKWRVPENAKDGFYLVKAYFPMKRKFNIAGLTFMSSVPGASTSFELTGRKSAVMLDKNRTFFNGLSYQFRAPLPEVEPESPVEIRTFLDNPDVDQVNVSYDLFYWDDIEEVMGAYSRSETVSDSRELIYRIESLPVGVYVARITAVSGEWKSIVKLRFFIAGEKARFVWAGLDHFPVMEGDNTTLAFCLSNAAVEPSDEEYVYPVKARVQLTDSDGVSLVDETIDIEDLKAQIVGRKISFDSGKRYTKLKLDASIYDAGGGLMDNVVLVYDYSKFLNIERSFDLELTQKTKDKVSFTVGYTDVYGDPLEGDVVVYLSSPGRAVVGIVEEHVTGSLTSELGLSGLEDGTYTLKAVEKASGLKDEELIEVTAVESIPSTTVPVVATTTLPQDDVETETATFPTAIYALLAIVVIVFIVYFIKKGGKK